MIELFQMGGPILWFQGALVFFAMVLVFERLLFYQTTRVSEKDLLTGLANHLRKRAYAEAIYESSQAIGPVGRVLHTIVTRHHLSRSELRGIGEDAVHMELPRIETNLRGLLTIVLLAPLSGMLGTVLGMMSIFFEIHSESGIIAQSMMAHGLFEALVTTAIGVTIALGVYICYIYLVSKARKMVYRLDAAAVNLVNIIIDARNYCTVTLTQQDAPSIEDSKP